MSGGFDVIVVGSGFGGSVAACRLAERGLDVLVLERGRRWSPEDYPREPGDPWIWDPDEPAEQHGWLDLRLFDDMAVAQGAGVGGGSLIYANVLVEAPEEIFEDGWPPEITYAGLKPHYEEVGRMMNVQEIPGGQLTERFRLMREGAEALGHGDRFRKLPLGVTFDDEWSYDLEEPLDERHSRTHTNAHGRRQGTCVHLANCDIGCDVQAKNTLDLNYLARAEDEGAEIRPLHVVRAIEPAGDGYRVRFERIVDGEMVPGSERAERVVVAAGSLGSTELLLRCRDEHGTLPRLSPYLGHSWSSNADFLTPAFYDDRRPSPTMGPTITSAIDFLDGSVDGQRFFIEDGGFPDLIHNWLREAQEEPAGRGGWKWAGRRVMGALRDGPPLERVMPWFAQGIDAADGRLHLGRKWWWPWKRELRLDWDVDASEGVVDAIVRMHERLAEATGGEPWVPPTWSVLENLVTPHPLGGCNMGTSPENGVVDHTGAVFGYDGLYVLDGAIVPEAIGRNPSRTIAALAERGVDLME